MLKPNLFILGAPKCGTTSLFSWLMQHNKIFTPREKEPHYFYNPYGTRPSAEHYFNLYASADKSHDYAVDASVWYLFSQTAVHQIVAETVNPKFIVCLRNPSELAISLHFQKLFSGHEAVSDFSEAWALSDERYMGAFSGIRGLRKDADPRHLSYKHACLLGEQTRKLFEVIDMKNIFFCFLDDIAQSPQKVFFELCQFLGVPAPEDIIFHVENRAKAQRSPWVGPTLNTIAKSKQFFGINRSTGLLSWAHNANKIERPYARPENKIKQEMHISFKEDIHLLQCVTGRDLSRWLST